MNKLMMITGLITISGCASLSSRMVGHVQGGDSEEAITKHFGNPLYVENLTQEGEDWIYKSGADTCKITFLNKMVEGASCEENPNYVSLEKKILRVTALVIGGIGDGMQQMQPTRTINCVSTTEGNQIFTTCR